MASDQGPTSPQDSRYERSPSFRRQLQYDLGYCRKVFLFSTSPGSTVIPGGFSGPRFVGPTDLRVVGSSGILNVRSSAFWSLIGTSDQRDWGGISFGISRVFESYRRPIFIVPGFGSYNNLTVRSNWDFSKSSSRPTSSSTKSALRSVATFWRAAFRDTSLLLDPKALSLRPQDPKTLRSSDPATLTSETLSP